MLAVSEVQAQQDLPTVWLGFDGPSDVEEGDTIRFRIFRDSVGLASALKGVAININPEGGSYLRVGEIGSPCPGYEHYVQDRCFTIPAGGESLTVDIPTYATTSFEKDTRIFIAVRGGLPQYHYRNHYIQGNPKNIHLTVRDGPDVPEFKPDTVTLSVLDATAAEGSSHDDALLHLRLSRDGKGGLTAGESLRVPLVFSGGQPGTDFTLSMLGASTGVALDAGTGTVTFTGPASGRSASEAFLALAASDDADAEDETVTVEIPVPVASGTARGVEGRRKGDGRIILIDDDDAALPEVTVSADASPVAEGEDAAFTISADPAPESPLAVRVTVAAEGDYGVTAGSRTVTVPASGSGKLSLPTEDDAVDEADGSVTVTVVSGSGYAAGSPAAGTVTIVDDDATADPVTVSLAVERDSITEENGETKFTISLSRALVAGETVTAPFTVTGGQANAHWNVAFRAGDSGAGVERTASGAHSEVRFTAGGRTAVLVLIGRPDADTADRVITIAFGTGARAPSATGVAGGIVLGTSSFDVTIVDDDVALPEVTIAADAGSVGEGGHASFTLTASPPPSGPLAVSVTVAASGDYGVTAGSRTVTIPASGSKKLILPTDDDAVDEADGSVTATVGAGDGYTVGSASSGTVSILDDDDAPLPEVTIAADAGSVGEGGDASFTLTASPPPSGPLAVDVTVAADGDYGVTAGSRTVTIPASGSKKLILPTDDDAVDEADGSVTVTVASGNGYAAGSASTATMTILDDDAAADPVTVSLDAERDSITEENGETKFTISLSRALVAGETVTVPFTVTGGQANAHWNVAFRAGDNGAGVERTAYGAHSEVRFTAGGWTAVLVLIGRPDADTADRVITVAFGTGARAPTATGVAGGIVLGASSFDVTIVDDDRVPPEVTVSADASSVDEGEDAVFTISADPAPQSPLAVDVTVAAEGDYGVTTGSRTVTIPASGSKKLILPTDDDAVDEADGSVTVTVASGNGYAAGSASTATMTILDDDAAAWEPKQEVVDSVKTVIAKHVPTAQGGTGNYGAWARLHRVLGGILGEDQVARYPGTDNKGRTHAEQTYQPFTAAECRAEARKFAVTNIWKPWCDEIARREQWEASTGTAGDRAPSAAPAVDAGAGALALLEGVTPETATAALYDGRVLDDARLGALDLLGNANGSYDLGDLLAWIAHCRRDAARCGGPGTASDGGSGPAAGLVPLGAGLAIRRPGRRRRGRARTPEQTAGRRRAARRPRLTVLALALAAAVWGCDTGGPGSPTEPAAPTGPGLLEVRVAVPAGARAAGAMLVVEGPGIDSVEPSAPGLELVHLGGAPTRREVIVAGELASGTLLRIGVPDTGNRARYRVTVVQVAGGDYELMDPADFEVALAR